MSAATSNHPFKNQQPVRRSLGEVGSSIVNRTAWNASHPMTLDTFFKKFDQFADAPDAVAKMRELVLRLAIQGGLVPNLSNEAAVPYKSLEEATPLNVSKVPSNWRIVLLADAIKNRSGNSKLIKGTLFDAPASNRYQGFSASGADVWCESYEHEGDAIIISAVGARCGKAFKASGKWCAIANTNIARPDPSLLDFNFAYLVLNDENFWVRGGSAQPFVKFPPSLKRHFALPPLAEQKRIVAKVDELMALCNRLEAQQQERDEQASALARASLARFAEAPTPANLNLLFHKSYSIPPADLRKAILTLAVQGKLIRFESRHAGKTVGDHIEFLNGYAFKSEWFKPSGVRLCRNANVSHGVIDWRESVFVDDDIAKEFERFVLREGDIVLSLDRPLITTGLKVARVKKSDLPCLLLQRVAKPVPKHDQLDLSFFLLWLNSSEFVDTIDPGRSNGVPHISTRQVQSLPFTLPPPAEQRRIVAKVDQLMALVDQLEAQLATTHVTAKDLLEALAAELSNASSSRIQ